MWKIKTFYYRATITGARSLSCTPCVYRVKWKACGRAHERGGSSITFPVVKGEETNEKGLKVQQSQTDISTWSQKCVGVTPQLLYSNPVTAGALFPSCSFHWMDVHSKRSISAFSETTSIKTPPPPPPPPPLSFSLCLSLSLILLCSPFLIHPLDLALFFLFFPHHCVSVSLFPFCNMT